MWDAGEPDAESFRQWIRHFQTAEEDEQRIHATYGTNFERLTEIKKVYDPDNMFRVNRNITPSV